MMLSLPDLMSEPEVPIIQPQPQANPAEHRQSSMQQQQLQEPFWRNTLNLKASSESHLELAQYEDLNTPLSQLRDQFESKESIDFVELEELPLKTLKRKREQADLADDFNMDHVDEMTVFQQYQAKRANPFDLFQ